MGPTSWTEGRAGAAPASQGQGRQARARAVIVGEPEATIRSMVAEPNAWSGMAGVALLENDAMN